MQTLLTGQVGIFFFADDGLLLHTRPLSGAHPYGDFLNYPFSHDAIWEHHHRAKYGVDFDYYPRGRVIYNRVASCYILYYDACIGKEVAEFAARKRALIAGGTGE